MFIANLTYIKPLTEVEKYLKEHIAYLDQYYEEGKFICSGRKNPRTGGIIIVKAEDAEEMNRIISEDPFSIHEVASYEIIEFYPTKQGVGVTGLIG